MLNKPFPIFFDFEKTFGHNIVKMESLPSSELKIICKECGQRYIDKDITKYVLKHLLSYVYDVIPFSVLENYHLINIEKIK
jgi:hypothetical protein